MSEIRVFDYLEPVYIKKIESIVEISNENDDVDLSCPINEEGTKYFLAFEKELLVSFICLYEYDNLDIFTGVYTELDLHKAFGELERKVEVEEKKALILVDKNQTSLVKYIEEKFLKIYSQKNVKIIYSDDYTKVSKNIEDFIKKNEKEKGNEI